MATISNSRTGKSFDTENLEDPAFYPSSYYFPDPAMQGYAEYMQDSAKYQNEWNSAQARQQMDFQKMMSDTAHQREVADLQAAGLNPILSANHQGATTAQGSSARASDPMSAVSSVVGAVTSAQASMENARVSAAANLAVAQLQAQSAQLIAKNQLYYDKWKTQNYANNMWQMISQFLNGSGASAYQLPSIARSAAAGIASLFGKKSRGTSVGFSGFSHGNGKF